MLDTVTVAKDQADYGWDQPTGGFPQSPIFETDYWSISYSRLRKALSDRLADLNPDVLVLPGWAFKESLVGAGWGLRHGARLVLVSDSQAVDHARSLPKETLKRLMVKGFDSAFVAGSPHVRYLAELGFDRTRCFIGCDVVDNSFFHASAAPSSAAGPARLLTCVRLLERKNLHAVVDALRARSGSEWRWTIAGDGPESAALERHIEDAGLSDRIDMLGHVPYRDLPGVYAEADVYLQPSLSEPWGLAVNEAMAAGLPVVVSERCGCAEDLVVPSVGETFDPSSIPEIGAALERMAARRAEWPSMGAAARTLISSWSIDAYAQGLLAASIDACEGVRSGHGLARWLGRIL